ncbi:MAG: DUF421 domain-containing protein [Clostridia bacterium]|nr:DUF421 domain-containing protein [Clostridia bacterium]
MIVNILRCVIIYFIVLIVIRVMGKRQIAQMQPFDVVITLIIADLATIPVADQSIPLLNGIVPLFVLTILHFLFTFVSCKNLGVRHFLNGKPVILVSPQGILEENIKKLNMTVADVMEACRYAGFISLEDINYMIMETNGNISVLPNSDASQITRSDMKIDMEDDKMPVVLISHGKLSRENLKITAVDENLLIDFLSDYNATIKEVVILHYASDGTIYLQIKGESKIVTNKILTQDGKMPKQEQIKME